MNNNQPTQYIPDGMSAIERGTKRLADLIGSVFCMIVFSPLIMYCYFLIKKEHDGPAIFKQERIGLHGKPFYIYKFRTMITNAELEGPTLSSTEGDSRLTQTGKFLRDHHLDELPQFWNVFIGDMSFIGPRPERRFFIDQIMANDSRYEYLYQIRPGVTSYATLNNGYTDTMEKMLRRLEMDLYYLQHRTLLLDIKILWLTFVSIVSGKKF